MKKWIVISLICWLFFAMPMTYAKTYKVTIQIHVNGGKLADEHGSRISVDNEGYVRLDGSRTIQTVNYGEQMGSTGLADAGNSSWINIERKGYYFLEPDVYNTKQDGSGRSYSQYEAYYASDFADVATQDKTVTLYVNWKRAVDYDWKQEEELHIQEIVPTKKVEYIRKDNMAYNKQNTYIPDMTLQGMAASDKYIVLGQVKGSNEGTNIVIVDRETYEIFGIDTRYNFGHCNTLTYDKESNTFFVAYYGVDASYHICSFQIDTDNYLLTNVQDVATATQHSAIAYAPDRKKMYSYWGNINCLSSNYQGVDASFSTKTNLVSQDMAYYKDHVLLVCWEAGYPNEYQKEYFNSAEKNSNVVYLYQVDDGQLDKTLYISSQSASGELESVFVDDNNILIAVYNTNNWGGIAIYEYDLSSEVTVQYTVNHYVETSTFGQYTLNQTETKQAKPFDLISISSLKKNIAGYPYVEGFVTGDTTKPEGGKRTTTFTLNNNARVINLYYHTNTFRVKYDANGGTGSMTDDLVLYGSSHTPKSCGFSKQGYSFAYWYEMYNGKRIKWSGNSWTWNYTRDITLYAQWTPYTVIYKANGGVGEDVLQAIEWHGIYDVKGYDTFTRKGYQCVGWSRSADSVNPTWTIENSTNWTWVYDQDITLYAVWKPKEYNVTYLYEDGSVYARDKATFDDIYTVKALPTGKGEWNDPIGVNWANWSGKWIWDNGEYGIANNELVLTLVRRPDLVVTNPSNGNWTNGNIPITLTGTDYGPGIKEYQWYDSARSLWTSEDITMTNGIGYTTFVINRNENVRFRVIDNAGNISNEVCSPIRIKRNYTVQFEGNGNTSGTTPNQTVTCGADATLSPNGYVKTKNTFYRWIDKANVRYENQANIRINTNMLNNTANMTAIGSSSNLFNGTWRSASGGTGTRSIIEVTDAPGDGITKGFAISGGTTASATDISQDNVPVTIGQKYTISVYAKGTGLLRLQAGNATYESGNFTLTNVTSWTRYQWTFIAGTNGSANHNQTNIYFGNGAKSGTIELCGMKLEAGEEATPYMDNANSTYSLRASWIPEGWNGMRGDVNHDQEIDILDVRLLLQIVLNQSSFTEAEYDIMDVFEDETIDILDVRELLQLVINQ